MSNSLILSIVVPIYNVELYLEKCIDSLLTQDISSDEYEIICVDDGSSDKCPEILAKYEYQYKNFIVVHKENGGVSSARNCGIDKAKGEYIWFVDSDDFIKENSLSKIVSVLRKKDYERVQIYPYAFKDKDTGFSLDEISVSMSQSEYKNFLWTQILKRDIIVDNKVYFDTEISYTEDAIFMMQVMSVIKNSIRLDDVVYFYRLRENSLMSQNLSKKIDSRIKSVIDCDEICDKKRFGDAREARRFKYQCTSIIMSNVATLPKKERKAYVAKLKSLGLFPLKHSPDYKLKKNYKNKSVSQKVKHFLSDRAYTKYGYRLLLTYLSVLKCFRHIKNIFSSKK